MHGGDQNFDQCWEDHIHGRATQQPDEIDAAEPYEPANIHVNTSMGASNERTPAQQQIYRENRENNAEFMP